MDMFTWQNFILALFGSGGVVLGILKIADLIKERVDKRRNERKELAKTEITNSIELEKAKIEAEHIDQEAVRQAIWELLKEKKAEVNSLKEENLDLRNSKSLTQSVIALLHSRLRALHREVDIMDELVRRESSLSDLAPQIVVIREGITRIEKALL
jgi:chromosome segregation ATPase